MLSQTDVLRRNFWVGLWPISQTFGGAAGRMGIIRVVPGDAIPCRNVSFFFAERSQPR